MGKTSKIIISISAVLIILVLGIILAVLENGRSVNNTGNTKIIQTSQGSISIKDYTQHPIATTNDAIIIEETSEFQILSYKADSSFLITLLSEPLKKSRTDAENAFLKDLNITQTQACSLKFSVVVPNSVDAGFSGQELGLDFCPNSINLP